MNYLCVLPKELRYKLEGFDEKIKYSILQTKEEIDWDDTLKINGKLYSIWSALPRGDDKCFCVDEFRFKEDPDYKIENNITCPYCGEQMSDSWDYGESEDNHYCDTCGSIYSWERVVTVDYRSDPVSKNEEIKEIS